jgi:hypothetical protein
VESCCLMKANQRSPPPRGRLRTALAAPGTSSRGCRLSPHSPGSSHTWSHVLSEGTKSAPIREMSITIRRPSAVFHSLKELPQMADLPSPAVYKADETQQASLDTTVETTVVALAALIPPQVNTFQRNWRFCPKLWFNGYPTNGRCAAGGAHVAHGWDFYLPANTQNPL